MSTARLGWVLAALLGCGAGLSSGQGPKAGEDLSEDARLGRHFLSLAKEAMKRGDKDGATESLRRAVRHDPAVVEAHYLLGKVSQSAGRRREAIQCFQRLGSLAKPQIGGDAKVAQWAKDAAKQLELLLVYRRAWDELRVEHGMKLRSLAGQHAGKPSCVRGIEMAVSLVPEHSEARSELAAAKSQVPQVVPPGPKKPDVKGAELLLGKARRLQKSGKAAEALSMILDAARLSQGAECLVALAAAYMEQDQPTKAAAVAFLAASKIDGAPEKRRRRLREQLENVRGRSDPGWGQVEALAVKFAEKAEALARRALKDNDPDTADMVLTAVVGILPDREPAKRLLRSMDKPQRADLQGLPNLDGPGIVCATQGARVSFSRTSSTVELRGSTTSSDKRPLAVGVELARLRWGSDLRAVWRVEQVNPSPLKPGGIVGAAISPVSGLTLSAHADSTDRTVVVGDVGRGFRTRKRAKDDALRKLFHVPRPKKDEKPTVSYEISFEKKDRTVRVRVGRTTVIEVELDRRQNESAASRAVVFKIVGAGPPYVAVQVRATVLEFSCSADCLRR